MANTLFDGADRATTGWRWSGVFLLVQLLFTGIFAWQLPPQIPLFYSLPYGSSQLADRGWFLMLPAFSVVVFLLHWVLISWGRRFMGIYIELLSWLSTLLLFLITVAMVHVTLLVL